MEASETEQRMLRSLLVRLAPTDEPKPTDEEIRRRSEAILAGQDRLALAALRRSYGDQAVSLTQMSRVAVPTLGIVGSADQFSTEFTDLKKAMPQMKLVVIQGASHGGSRGAAGRPEFVQAIRDFIAANHRASVR
jgi:pimeloyl-ACP methyl ester carboxylesterase